MNIVRIVLAAFALPMMASFASGQTLSSDDFNQFNLNRNVWTIVDPLNDASFTLTGTNTTNARISIAVPGGVAHDLYTSGNNAPRILQNASDTDFSVTAKFESAVSSSYQIQGILVEQTPGNFLRFDFYSDGGSTRMYAASINGGVFTQIADLAVGANNIQPLFMRLERSGNDWKQVVSFDGTTWTDSSAFSHAITVAKVGVYAGNADPGSGAPAHTALIDFFQNNASPLTAEDGNSSVPDTLAPYPYSKVATPTSSSIQFTWKTDEPANGRVEYGTTTSYELGFLSHPNFLTSHALQANGLASSTLYHYRIISTDGGGRSDTTADMTVSTTDSYLLTNVRVNPTSASATFQWETSVLTTGRIAYGLTTAYGDTLSDTTLATSHFLNFTGLSPSTLYHFKIIARDTGSTLVSTTDSTFTTSAASTLVSDEFNSGTLSGVWQFFNPSGDGTQVMTGTQLALGVPSGSRHDIWTDVKNAPRVAQTTNNADFEITVKLDTGMTERYQIQGLVFQQDSINLVRIDVNSDGIGTSIFAVTFTNNSESVKLNQGIGALGAQPLYLRVTRSGAEFKIEYSFNGSTWVEATKFNHILSVSTAGLFTGNADNNPAFTSHVDYFRVTGGVQSVTVNAKAILEGGYSVLGDTMRTNIRAVMPLTQPYNVAPWSYPGTESVASIPEGVVDWILVEIRTSTSPGSRVAYKAGFIKSDGSIVNTTGTGGVTFVNVAAGNYYLVLNHRNHLAVMSGNTIALSASSPLYDFSTASSQAFGTNPMNEVSTGRWALVSGDANKSGIVTASDANDVFAALNVAGYNISDINLSGIVTAADANIVFGNLNRATQVP